MKTAIFDFLISALPWIAIGIFVAIMEMLDGNKSSGTTWLILGVFNAVLNFANTRKE